MSKTNREAKGYLAFGVVLVFVLIGVLWSVKWAIVIALGWTALNCFYIGVDTIKSRRS